MSPKKRLASKPTRATPAPVKTKKPDPMVWTKAKELAKGDLGRLTVLDDGSVLVE